MLKFVFPVEVALGEGEGGVVGGFGHDGVHVGMEERNGIVFVFVLVLGL